MADTEDTFAALLQAGKQAGYLSQRQVHDALAQQEQVTPALVDRLLLLLEEQGIELVEDEDARRRQAEEEVQEPQEALPEQDEQPARHDPVGDPALHEAFLADIVAHPEDDTPRLVYADWLTEQGSGQGEYIRVQVGLARLEEDDPRREELEERAGQLEEVGWWEPEPPEGVGIQGWERGLVERVRVPFDTFLKRAAELFRWAPVRRVKLTSGRYGDLSPAHMEALAGLPDLARLVELDLGALGLWGEHLEALLRSPHLGNLRSLNLRNNPLTPDGPWLVAGCPGLPRLTALDLSEYGMQDADLEALLLPPLVWRLSELCLEVDDPEHGALTDAGLRSLAAAPWARLATLSLAGNYFTAEGIAALAHSPNMPSLADVNLRGWTTWEWGVRPVEGIAEALATSPLPARLTGLRLYGHQMGVAGLALLAAAPMPRLRHLELGGNALGADGLNALLAAPWAAGLRTLHLEDNALDSTALRALAGSTRLERLRDLSLADNGLGGVSVETLANWPLLRRLTALDLSGNRLVAADLRPLLTSPHLSPHLRVRVRELRLSDLRALVQQFGGKLPCAVWAWNA
jgi:uncharacterized protein (TIGR02996 family)